MTFLTMSGAVVEPSWTHTSPAASLPPRPETIVCAPLTGPSLTTGPTLSPEMASGRSKVGRVGAVDMVWGRWGEWVQASLGRSLKLPGFSSLVPDECFPSGIRPSTYGAYGAPYGKPDRSV